MDSLSKFLEISGENKKKDIVAQYREALEENILYKVIQQLSKVYVTI